MNHKIRYDANRFPIQPAKDLCRGCHQILPKFKRAWCSRECYKRYHPAEVRNACFKRDKGICALCGVDTYRMERRFKTVRDLFLSQQERRFWNHHKFFRERYERAVAIRHRHNPQLLRAAENRRKRLIQAGWPNHACRDWWEMDHIVPFSQGGITVLENVRTLCVPCHKKVTKEWRRKLKVISPLDKPPSTP